MHTGSQNPASASVLRQSLISSSNSLFWNILALSLLDPIFYGDMIAGIKLKYLRFNILPVLKSKKSAIEHLAEVCANPLFRNILHVRYLSSIFCRDRQSPLDPKSFRHNILWRLAEKICLASERPQISIH